jgi:hypothetical protein
LKGFQSPVTLELNRQNKSVVEIIGSRRLTIESFIYDKTVTGVRNKWYNVVNESAELVARVRIVSFLEKSDCKVAIKSVK